MDAVMYIQLLRQYLLNQVNIGKMSLEQANAFGQQVQDRFVRNPQITPDLFGYNEVMALAQTSQRRPSLLNPTGEVQLPAETEGEGQVSGQFDEDAYRRALKSHLALNGWTAKQIKAYFKDYVEPDLAAGAFGYGMPYFKEMYEQWMGPQPEPEEEKGVSEWQYMMGQLTPEQQQQWALSRAGIETQKTPEQLQAEATAQFQAGERGRWGRNAAQEAFEAERTRQMTSLGGPQDWITRWFTERGTNPYAMTALEQLRPEVARWQYAEEPQARQKATDLAQMLGDVAALSGGLASHAPWTSELIEAQMDLLKAGKILTGLQAQESALESQPQKPVAGPPTPPWMAQWTGGQAGQPLAQRGEITTPSGQLMTSTSPSQWSMLKGLGEYWSRPIEDVRQAATSMLPLTSPSGTRRWKPAAQLM